VVAEYVHTHPMDVHCKFRGGEGSQRLKFLKESMKLNWNFWRSGGVKSENPSVGEIRIFPGTTSCATVLIQQKKNLQFGWSSSFSHCHLLNALLQ